MATSIKITYLRLHALWPYVSPRPVFSLPKDQPVSPPESLPSPDSRSGIVCSTFKVEVSRCFVKRVVSEKERKKKATVSWWLRALWRYITYTRPSYGHQNCKCSSWPHVTKASTSEQAFVTWTKGDLQVCKRKCHSCNHSGGEIELFCLALGIYVLDILLD